MRMIIDIVANEMVSENKLEAENEENSEKKSGDERRKKPLEDGTELVLVM